MAVEMVEKWVVEKAAMSVGEMAGEMAGKKVDVSVAARVEL